MDYDKYKERLEQMNRSQLQQFRDNYNPDLYTEDGKK